MKNQKGITLIALVITIIVLLILAGVSISMVIGDNGIIKQANDAKTKTHAASEQEQVELALLAAKMLTYTNGGEVDAAAINQQLSDAGVNATAEFKGGELVVTFNDTNSEYKVNGEIVTKVEKPDSGNTGSTEGSLASQITSANYGDYVNYPADLGIATKGESLADDTAPKTDWRIFYEDGTNVYLIASDYLPSSKFPSGVFEKTNINKGGGWAINSSDTTKLTTSGTVTSNNSFLFTKLLNVGTNNLNYQAVTTLLDTNKWSVFAKTGYVDNVNTSVIGSPTLEMWIASWNQKYKNDTLAFDANTTGYQVGLKGNSLDTYVNLAAKEGSGDTLYFPRVSFVCGSDDIFGYWLASPSSREANFVMTVDYGCSVGESHYVSSNINVRPIVSLKSGITATKDANGIWQLGE